MDPRQEEFLDTFQTFINDVVQQHRRRRGLDELTPFGQLVERHLGVDVRALPVVEEPIARHRLVDVDIALEHLAGEGSQLLGLTGGQSRHHSQLAELLSNPHMPYAPGPVDFIAAPTGPHSHRQVVAFGVRLFTFEGEPVAVLQRGAQPQFGRDAAALELLTPTAALSDRLLQEVRRLMVDLSVLRGQVLSFDGGEFHGPSAAGAVFLERPDVPAEQVVLPDGVLESIRRHVVGITEGRDELLRAGQHLKRGVLLYGPPGTGKTLTVRHLIGVADRVTCVLLTGASIRFIREAADLARAMQPALVVLEDVDLVAMERGMHGGPQPLLFAVLDALDGLDGDADVAFVLTTNRVETLEPALAQRPGRVDLAVEVPLPDAATRRRLFRLYAAGLPLSEEAIDAAAERSEGVTGSFAKELMRRAVLLAVAEGRPVADSDLSAALDELLSAASLLTRRLLGVTGDGGGFTGEGPAHPSGFAFAAG
ncbi:ATPase family protein associated with various cellular activities (AAA) [Diaminobutyricimonas aerilata]|uniref:ATPase family protein associated with various cellular activities (AAA) n=1 Tax=Diaminobutyricimonas aerilata TaxID=1162967 RepID=A0A2M9CNG6_9MICO|nr:AAA family ATPase [Diaminobutyricimonas aerilata]PJJ73455.1 ATPase family protein associated with various cellular activities (AAA) [Diaminobutyricimonas aerilata]